MAKTKKSGNGKNLVIVESPAKAKTINKYLGSDYVVKASMLVARFRAGRWKKITI